MAYFNRSVLVGLKENSRENDQPLMVAKMEEDFTDAELGSNE